MNRRNYVRALLAAPLMLAACAAEQPSNTLRVSGQVEATEIQVGAEVGGRILELRVAEGDRVNHGDTIARLDTRDTELQIQRSRADRAAAIAQLRLLEAGSRAEDVRQAQAQVDAAQADVTAIESELRSAQLDLDRFESLLKANAGSEKQRDDAKARVDVARERQRGAQDRVRAAREVVIRLQRGSRPEEIDAARARVAAGDAQIAILDKSLADAQIVAPVSGVVTQKLADVGEIIARGTPVLVITDLDNAWANLFVPEPMVPRVKLGQPATVRTDAGGQGIPGKVTFISSKAEFTPRNVQTAEERSKLVYRIKVSVDNRAGVLKSGMPVDAELGLQ
ncbi:MAG TPA: HlyD family efflux transporter periplasmic adaptor subunit [Vicinamibacterales bacterium]|nr:HlyD family efflux transporter periplasmic adaptor subunit [Vicinamibacterales bacterium]